MISHSMRYNLKTWGPQPHDLNFFLISSFFSVSSTISIIVVWMSRERYIAWEIRKGLSPNNNPSHSWEDSFQIIKKLILNYKKQTLLWIMKKTLQIIKTKLLLSYKNKLILNYKYKAYFKL